MKYLIAFAFFTLSLGLSAQDVFKEEMFSTDLVMKYRSEIKLSDAQADQIKKAHSAHIEAFNNTKWDLDNALHQLKKELYVAKVDESSAMARMNKVLALEDDLKRMRLALMINIKNSLSTNQQAKLKELRTDADLDNPVFHISSINDHPRMVLKIDGDKEGKAQPLFVLFDKKGKKSIVSSVEDVSPDDIESINVLKGESAISRYGQDGKNGVVEITLKK